MYWGFGEKKRGRLATDISSRPIFLTKKAKKKKKSKVNLILYENKKKSELLVYGTRQYMYSLSKSVTPHAIRNLIASHKHHIVSAVERIQVVKRKKFSLHTTCSAETVTTPDEQASLKGFFLLAFMFISSGTYKANWS